MHYHITLMIVIGRDRNKMRMLILIETFYRSLNFGNSLNSTLLNHSTFNIQPFIFSEKKNRFGENRIGIKLSTKLIKHLVQKIKISLNIKRALYSSFKIKILNDWQNKIVNIFYQ